jgi:hypothetical protein
VAGQPDRRGSISLPVLVAIVIGIAVIAVVTALVWRPLATSLHLAPVPMPTRGGHQADLHDHAAAASSARAP